MNLKKKALATAVFMALSAAPAVLPVNYMATSVVCAAPASEVKASDAFQVDFKNGMPKGFEASDGWTNGNMFNVNWHKENVTFDNGNLQLVIDNEKNPGKIPYAGG